MTHASVFSGIGGPEVAAEMMGWENLFHCEINPFGRAVLDYWFPKSESYEDITKTDFTKWRGKVNVLTGGFPCQPFSYAGQRRGATDDRYLWPHMHRCINEIRSDWVVCENVSGILTMVEQGSIAEVASFPTLFGSVVDVHRYQYRGTFTLERICCDLEADGYEVQPMLIPACGVGAPHQRNRVFVVGHRNITDASDARIEGMRQERENPIYGFETSSDPSGCGQSASEQQGKRTRQTVQQEGRKQSLDGIGRPCTSPITADTNNGDVQDGGNVKKGMGQKDSGRKAGRCLHGCLQDAEGEWSTEPGWRWRHFPTVPPIHGRNDGFPIPLDRLTISSGKWRTESLKAYGNAIVPEVMYEIFRAIEQADKDSTRKDVAY